MILRYILLLLLTNISLLGSENYLITAHVDNLPSDGQFIFCTNSGNFGVDCGIFSVVNNKPILLLSTYIKNDNIKNFTLAVSDLLSYIKDSYGIVIQHACFAGPGVPSRQQDYLTHMRLPYVIDAKEIITDCGLKTATIVNDFLAMSYGIDFLDDTKKITLYDVPAELHARRVIIGAGSGLGSVSMTWNDQQQGYTSFPAEAGTGNFPAFDQFELDLAIRMKQLRNMDTVHWAFFVALPGIHYTYQILQDINYENCSSDKKYSDGMAILADANIDVCCGKTADLFYKFYARFVYNFVWNTLPFGGIYLVGETATTHPEMLTTIFLPEYFNCVESKRPLLQRIPIYIIKDDVSVGLYGIAHYFLTEKKEILMANSFFGGLQKNICSLWSTLKDSIFSC